ncbi:MULTISPECIES: J domain-containing protein [unclassified Pseudomonas]|uniref:J domain-containing protein n=1 Tax=unclassified Pseudomonas TaxID=196821 RepID=UPI00200CFAC0|nr:MULTISPECIES: J domain-containing protein [unclassified Pseudomonas]
MNCWAILGLEPDSDLRSIRRQYAALLKVHRPDEDPSGFQRLREAYEQAVELNHRAIAQIHLEPVIERPLPTSLLEQADFAPRDPAAQRAEELLVDVHVEQLAERLAQARVAHCEREFEDRLLAMCLSARDDRMQLTAWGMEHFNWFNVWQRKGLSPTVLEILLKKYCDHVYQELRELLDAGRIADFTERFLALKRADWLQPFERHDWFNNTLARLLAESTVWSSQLFETVSTHQQWSSDDESRCPRAYWPRLSKRRDEQVFIETLERLAELNDRVPENRAARMLLAPMSNDERRSFARRFLEADWNACLTLSEQLKRMNPERVRQMPDGDVFFWKALVPPGQKWPMSAGILGASLGLLISPLIFDQSVLITTLVAVLLWVCVLSGAAAALLWAWRPLADRIWTLDERLSRVLSPQLSFRRPSPLLLREIVPCWLIAALTWIACGPIAFAGYAAGMVAASALSRTDRFKTLSVSRPALRFPALGTAGSIAVMACVIGITVLVFLVVRAQLMGPDQGLQPFAQRACGGAFDSRPECRIAPTREQWYGHSQAQEARR